MSDIANIFALRHLVAAQGYKPTINRAHPIEAVRDDIFTHKFDTNGKLKARSKQDLQLLKNQVSQYYDYFLFLKDNSANIYTRLDSFAKVKLYRGSTRFITDQKIYYALPTSWTNSIQKALDHIGNDNIQRNDKSGSCCLLEIEYPVRSLMAYHAFHPNFMLNGQLITENYSSQSNLLEQAGIYIHNQPEFEVILPPINIKFDGYFDLTINEQKIFVIKSQLGGPVPNKMKALRQLDEHYAGD